MKKILLIIPFLLIGYIVNAQQQADSIYYKKEFLDVHFYRNDKRLTGRQLKEIINTYEAARPEMKLATKNGTYSLITGLSGGFLLGWGLGSFFSSDKDPEVVLIGVGAALTIVSIPLTNAFVKHAKNAVSIYNEGLNKTSELKTSFKFNVSENRIGLVMEF